jgi:hypothetical protein
MRKLVLYFVILLFAPVVQAQTQDQNELNRMISESLAASIKAYNEASIKHYHGRYYKIEGLIVDNYPRNYILPDSIANSGLLFITLMHGGRVKIPRQEKYYIRFDSIELLGNQLILSFSPKVINKRGRKVHIATGDWDKYYYRYSCETNKWVFEKVERGGI